MKVQEYRRLDGLALASLIAAGEVSAGEVTDAALEAIDTIDPALGAVVDRCDAAARRRAGEELPPGRLSGVPFLLKDVNLYAADLPLRFACRFFADARPRPDSTLVRRWREAGLVVCGRTNTPEFAEDFVTEPRFRGLTLNPWNAGVTVGGSSGGAAAAVAAGMVPLAHATDLAGSIRIPSACCGVFGFKPSVGLNPLGPYFEEIAGGLDSDHVLTRSVRDSAASLDVTAGPEAGTRAAVSPPVGGYLAALEERFDRLTIGFAVEDPAGRRAGAAQVEAVERTAALLGDLGHTVVPWRYPAAAEVGAWFDILWGTDVALLVAERARELGRAPAEDELEPLTRSIVDWIAGLGATDYLDAKLRMKQAAVAIMQAMDGLDVVLTPSLAEDPPPLGELGFVANGCDLEAWNTRGYAFSPFSPPANLTGQPAASCPVMLTDAGLPVGVQIAGRPGRDLVVLQLSREIERAGLWIDLPVDP